MNDKVIKIIARGLDEASGPLGKVGGAVGGLGSIAAGIATGGLAVAGTALLAVGTAAVFVGKQIFDFSQESEAAMGRFQAQTGASALEMLAFTQAAKDIYAAGVGESISEVADVMAQVHHATGLTGDELTAVTTKAARLSKVFKFDVAKSTATVSSMMKSMGISADHAYDIIVKGSQMGLDVQDDLLDTLHEYSGDFDNLGFTAEQTLAMLNAGLEEGAYNTDVIADGWREYNIRLMEGGEDISELFTTMGLDFDLISDSVAAGDETWGDYASNVVEGLMSIESEVERNAAGVAIFGTKWEDLGGSIFLASGMAMEGIEGVGGASDDAADTVSTGLGPALETLKRTFITEFSPLGDLAGEVINDKIIPFLTNAAGWLGEHVPGAIVELERVWEEDLMPALESSVDWLGTNVPLAIEALDRAFDNLEEGWGQIAESYWNDLDPALFALWETLGLNKDRTDGLRESTYAYFNVFKEERRLRLVDGITAGMQLLAIAAMFADEAFGYLKEGLNMVWGALKKVWEWINRNKDAWGNLNIPPWLQPGSPSPLENTLVGISEALATMPSLTMALSIPDIPQMGAFTGAGGGAAAGTFEIHNHFGQDSVRSDEDILSIADAIDNVLMIRGLQPAL